MSKKVAIGGCRYYTDYKLFKSCLDEILKDQKDEIIIISGHCSGVDLMAERYAAESGLKAEIFYPEWEKYGRAAGPIRNKKMVEAANIVIAFWDGKSKGTESVIRYCEKTGKKCEIISIKEEQHLD